MSGPTPLSEVINFGPATLKEFEAMGLTTLEQLQELGWEEVSRRWIQYFPERLNLNAIASLVASMDGVAWNKISKSRKDEARALVNELRRQHGLPPSKVSKKRRAT